MSIIYIEKVDKAEAMKLTTKGEYTLLALIYIARHEKSGFIKIEDICSHCKIPKKYLEFLLSTLRQGGILKTKRGASGGYKLAMPSKKINIAQIVRLMDGALAPSESVSEYFFAHTPLEKEKKMIRVLREIRDYTADRLEGLKLSDVV